MLSSEIFESGYQVSGSSEIAKKENNDCVVRAIANSFGVNYEQAHTFVADKFDRKKGKGTKFAISTMKTLSKEPITFPALGQLDLFNEDEKVINIKHMGDSPKRGGKLINKSYKHKPVAYTVKTFLQNFKKGKYFVLVNKHAFAVNNGVLVDNPGMRFNGYRRTVEAAFQIK